MRKILILALGAGAVWLAHRSWCSLQELQEMLVQARTQLDETEQAIRALEEHQRAG